MPELFRGNFFFWGGGRKEGADGPGGFREGGCDVERWFGREREGIGVLGGARVDEAAGLAGWEEMMGALQEESAAVAGWGGHFCVC